MSAIVVRSERYGRIGRSMNSARRCPPSVVTSSPTMTSTSGRDRGPSPGRRGGIDALVVGDGDDVEVGRFARRGRGSPSTSAVPSDARVWMCRSARPAVDRGSVRRGLARDVGRRLEVGPDREEHRPPLFRRVRDEPLERPRRAAVRRRDPFAAGALGRDGDGLHAPEVAAAAGPPDADDVDRRAALDGEHRRARAAAWRGPRKADRHAAAGQVAVADEADARPARSAASSSRRASRRPTIRTPAAPRVRINHA